MDEWLAWLTETTGAISGFLWDNVVTLAALLGVGAYLTVRLGFVQIRGFRHGLDLVRGRHAQPDAQGQVTHFQALATALSATVGTGNIAGVATAISLGGPGALFWMWITAVFGMATKFAECSLALRFREVGAGGEVAGGPMYTLWHGLGMRRTGAAFALFTMIAALGIGNMVQANSVVDGLAFVWPGLDRYGWLVGVIMATLVGLVIVGGIRRIARTAAVLVPFMAVLYMAGAIVVLLVYLPAIPGALAAIFNQALNPWAAGGAAMGEAIRWGVARGVFSNEAGLGSSAMAHAAARTHEPTREGLVAMMEPFIDTLVICTLTGLAIVVTGSHLAVTGEASASITVHAFTQALGEPGGWLVGLGLTLFAFSTTIAWSYYGDRSARYLFGDRAVMPYRLVFTALVVVGASVPLQLVWNLADIANLLMVVPNLIALILLAGLVKRMSDKYMKEWKAEGERG